MEEEIYFPYTKVMHDTDFHLLLEILRPADAAVPEYLCLEPQFLNKFSKPELQEQFETILQEGFWAVRDEDGTVHTPENSTADLILTCLTKPDFVVDFSDYSLKLSKERVMLYVHAFRNEKIFLTLHRDSDRNLAECRIDSASSQSASYIMSFWQKQQPQNSRLQNQLLEMFAQMPPALEATESGVRHLASMQVFVPLSEENVITGQHYQIKSLAYLIQFRNGVNGLFYADEEKPNFKENFLCSENDPAEKLLSDWLEGLPE